VTVNKLGSKGIGEREEELDPEGVQYCGSGSGVDRVDIVCMSFRFTAGLIPECSVPFAFNFTVSFSSARRLM